MAYTLRHLFFCLIISITWGWSDDAKRFDRLEQLEQILQTALDSQKHLSEEDLRKHNEISAKLIDSSLAQMQLLLVDMPQEFLLGKKCISSLAYDEMRERLRQLVTALTYIGTTPTTTSSFQELLEQLLSEWRKGSKEYREILRKTYPPAKK